MKIINYRMNLPDNRVMLYHRVVSVDEKVSHSVVKSIQIGAWQSLDSMVSGSKHEHVTVAEVEMNTAAPEFFAALPQLCIDALGWNGAQIVEV